MKSEANLLSFKVIDRIIRSQKDVTKDDYIQRGVDATLYSEHTIAWHTHISTVYEIL
jgi:hypothetical protein